MYCLEICQFVVVCIYADAKEQAGIPPVYNLVVAELSVIYQ
jgi:hypothetical protein